jgi:hypothetical protein
MGTMNQDLDTLLNTPLAALADDGFSSRVTARIARRARIENALTWGTFGLCALVLLAFLPIPTLITSLVQLATTPAVVVSAGILALVWAWEPRMFRL